MEKLELLIAGFGGQGVLFSGKLIAYTALMEDKEVSWLPSYGPEMRGGTANCSVIVSDEPVGSPIVDRPDCLIAMNLPSFIKYRDAVKPGGTILIDSTLIDADTDRTDVSVFRVPATALAKEAELSGLSNIILTGKFLRECMSGSFETAVKALSKVVPAKKAHLIEANVQALAIGFSFEE